MPAYSITEADVIDPEGLRRYVELSSAAVHNYGGRYLVRGEPTPAEGTWPPARRLVVIAFPDMATLRAWYDSPEYAPARALAATAVHRRVLFADGEHDPPPGPADAHRGTEGAVAAVETAK
jgi:uncharacterized protein (DUF1330 family)